MRVMQSSPVPSRPQFAGGGELVGPDAARVRELVERAVAVQVAAVLETRVDALVEQKVAQIVGTLAPPQNAALQAARERGAAYARQQYARSDNLALQEAAKLTGRSEKWINQRRNDDRLYALVLDGNSRGFRYPAWQFDAQDERLAAVLAVLTDAKVSCWLVHDFMERASDVLGGERPCDWIVDPARPIEPVLLAAQRRFAGDQGAG